MLKLVVYFANFGFLHINLYSLLSKEKKSVKSQINRSKIKKSMERIKLSKNEKVVLRMIAPRHRGCPAGYPLHKFAIAVRLLESKGLVKVMRQEGGEIVDTKLTEQGVIYMEENPRPINSINWSVVATIISIVISIIAMFIACR